MLPNFNTTYPPHETNTRTAFSAQSIMPNAPPLTTTEAKMVEEKKQSLLSLAPKAKRLPETLLSDTQKFIFVENASSSVFGVSHSTMDTSASNILAELAVINTYEEDRIHKENNLDLPRRIWDNIDNTRSQQYSTGMRLPPPLDPRRFDGWRCWKKVTNRKGAVSYIFALAPMSEYRGDTRKMEMPGKFEQGEATEIFIITEVASQVCSVLRVQQATLNSMLPLPVLIRITKKQMSWADRLQSKYRRNNKQVDSETREGLIKSMQEGATGEQGLENMNMTYIHMGKQCQLLTRLAHLRAARGTGGDYQGLRERISGGRRVAILALTLPSS